MSDHRFGTKNCVDLEFICDFCGSTFFRPEAYARPTKTGRRFCQRICASKGLRSKNERLMTQFKRFISMMKTRAEVSISAEELLAIWLDQNGICPVTGWAMELPQNFTGWPYSKSKTPKRASPDRIKPQEGYTKDNTRFVCVIANYAKSQFTDSQVVEFAEAVSAKWSPRPDSHRQPQPSQGCALSN